MKKIKNILVVAMSLLIMTLIGCSGGGNPAGPSSSSYEELIIGTWKWEAGGGDVISTYKPGGIYEGKSFVNGLWRAHTFDRWEIRNGVVKSGYEPETSDNVLAQYSSSGLLSGPEWAASVRIIFINNERMETQGWSQGERRASVIVWLKISN